MKSTLFISTLLIIFSSSPMCYAAEHNNIVKKEAYILLDKKGKPNSKAARCATIQQSGLTWELKTDDDGIHDKDNVYRWGGMGAEKTGAIFFDDWNTLLNAANREKLCGFNDWRVPTIDELKTLVTNTAIKPVVNPEIFPLTQSLPYWSTSTYQNYPEHAQTVDFSTGASNYYNGFRGDRLPLRLVRGDKTK
ncbi:MAG: DUF1566 domain-containing protein [Cellvibrio sp.]|uniref:Lcl C-terminal domain-containing protein n=1 Tax=Cellvibrio sp. TaxID=1965322 RepID=UPI0031AD263E